MADFDAGSIEGRVELDVDPFVAGLRYARQQAAEFERSNISATAHVNTEYDTDGNQPDLHDTTTTATVRADDSQFRETVDRDEARLRALGAERATPEVDVDTDRASAGIGRLRDELGRFRSSTEHEHVDVDVDTNRASAALAALSRHVDNAVGFYRRNSSMGMGGGGGHGMMALVGMAAALAPALGPATGAVGLFGGAAVAAFGGAALSMALYAKVASGAFSKIQDAIKAGKQLPGMAGHAETALKSMSSAWSDLQKKADPGIFRVMSLVFGTLAGQIPKLLPLINAISTGLEGAFYPIAHILDSGQFTAFIRLLSSNAMKDLPQIGTILAHGLSAAMKLFTAMNPIITIMLHTVTRLSGEFDKWAGTKAPEFIDQLFDTVKKYGPATIRLVGGLMSAIANIARGLAPLTGPALHFLNGLMSALKGINLAPLAKGVGDVLKTLTPFLGVLGKLINVLLPPLGTLLSTLADSFIGPLGKSLQDVLVPAFGALADVLDFAAPFLGKIISSFADLVNPTGVGAFAALMQGLVPVVEALIPPVSDLIIALESMVDDGLEAITPAIGPVTAALKIVADAVAPIVDALAWFLGHKAVADTILAIAAAVKIWSIYQAILDALWDASTIGLVVIAIAALAVGIVALVQHWGQVTKALGWVWDKMKGFAGWIAGGFMHAVHAVGDFFKNLGGWIMDGVGAAIDWLKSHWDIIGIFVAPWAAIPIELAKHWQDVLAFLEKIPGWITGALSGAGSWLKELGGKIINGLWAGMRNIWNTEVQGWQKIGSTIKGWFDGAADWLRELGKKVIRGMWAGFKTAWNAEVSTYKNIGRTIKGWFSGALDWLKTAGRNVINGMWSGFKTAWNAEVHVYSSIGSTIKGWFSGAIGWLSSAGHNIINGLWGGIKDIWGNVTSWLGSIGSKILSAVGDLSWTLYNAGWSLISGLLKGITDKFDDVKNFVSGIAGWVGSHKGPLDYDRVLLIPHGRAIMSGLQEGLETGFQSVKSTVSGMAPQLAGVMGSAASGAVALTASTTVSPAMVSRPSPAEAHIQATLDKNALTEGNMVILLRQTVILLRELHSASERLVDATNREHAHDRETARNQAQREINTLQRQFEELMDVIRNQDSSMARRITAQIRKL